MFSYEIPDLLHAYGGMRQFPQYFVRQIFALRYLYCNYGIVRYPFYF